MKLHRYALDVDLDDLVRDARRAIAGWDWADGAFGHALSLPDYRELHPFGRYRYQNYPCTGLLAVCPAFRALFDGLRCDKVSFRLLRRGPASAYGWHTDRWKGAGVVRFQVPILSDPTAFLVLTDYTSPGQVMGSQTLGTAAFDDFAAANAGHFATHGLEPGRLHYFDTSVVHTLVNPAPVERITLSFDLVANDWVCARFPEVRDEIGEAPPGALPSSGPLGTGFAFVRSRFYPLRNRLRRIRAGAERT